MLNVLTKKGAILSAKTVLQGFIGLIILLLAIPPVKIFYFNSGIRWVYILFLSFFAAYFITPFCRTIALRFNILDSPDWRKTHDQPTPLLGGLAVYIAFMLSLLFNNIFLPGTKILLTGGSMMFFMGLWDDIKPLPALLKFILQIIISCFVIFAGEVQLPRQFPVF